jgi:hypothetical protein
MQSCCYYCCINTTNTRIATLDALFSDKVLTSLSKMFYRILTRKRTIEVCVFYRWAVHFIDTELKIVFTPTKLCGDPTKMLRVSLTQKCVDHTNDLWSVLSTRLWNVWGLWHWNIPCAFFRCLSTLKSSHAHRILIVSKIWFFKIFNWILKGVY